MCHHVDRAIDWEEVVTDTETEADELDEADERGVDSEASTPELTHPADD